MLGGVKPASMTERDSYLRQKCPDDMEPIGIPMATYIRALLTLVFSPSVPDARRDGPGDYATRFISSSAGYNLPPTETS